MGPAAITLVLLMLNMFNGKPCNAFCFHIFFLVLLLTLWPVVLQHT